MEITGSIDVAALSMAMSQSKVMNDFSTAMLSKSLDNYQETGDMLTKVVMEQSVAPNVGGNVDISL